MGLTALAFLVAPALVLLGLSAARRGRVAGAAAAAIDWLLAAFCLCEGLAFSLATVGSEDLPLRLELAAGAFLLAAQLALVYLALAFPDPVPIVARIPALAVLLAMATLGAYRILFTTDYVVSLFRTASGVARIDGARFRLYSGGGIAIGIAASAALAARSFRAKDRMSRQKAAIAAAAVLTGAAAIWLFSVGLPSFSGVRSSHGIVPLGALVLGAFVTYAQSLDRVFDWKAAGWTAASYGALFAATGLPAGLAAYFLGFLWRISPLFASFGAISVFLAAFVGAHALSTRFFERTRNRGDYREELESALSHVDLSTGREEVLAELSGLMTSALDASDFNVLIEDERGALRIALSTSESKLAIDRDSPLCLALEAADRSIILKSDALAASEFERARAEAAALFESLKAEVLIVAREGRHAIGVFALGPRRTGAQYAAYDLDAFKAIYGKLFVFAYYLKNVAKEHLLHTVDREIALSDQVIRFAVEKVDKVDRPGVDAAWTMRSTRRLGGDFVDFVRLSPDRWFFVLGDVSGKGLSASMNMLILKSMIRTFLRVERSLSALVSKVNASIKSNLPRGTFFAGAFGYFDFAEGSLYYINCGVPAILLYSPGLDTFIEVQGEGRVLGFVRDISPYVKPRKIAVPPGSVLAAATDGVTDSESLRGERFGKERLKRSIRERLDHPSQEIADGVVDDLLAFTDRKQEDDITLLVMKISGRSAQ